tara:strand:+ start:706 stop:927 length:222 start_codon:yes stop_codon:yes gene_type:complete
LPQQSKESPQQSRQPEKNKTISKAQTHFSTTTIATATATPLRFFYPCETLASLTGHRTRDTVLGQTLFQPGTF